MYIKIKNQPNSKDNQNMKYQSPVRFSYLQSYLYLNLQENFFTIYQLLIQQPCVKDLLICFNSQENVTKDQSTYKFIRICQRLSLIRLFFVQNRNTYSNSMLKYILNKIKSILYKIDSKIFSTNNNKQTFSDVIDKILSGENIKKFYKQNSTKITQNIPLVFFVSNKQQQHGSKVQKQQNKNSLYQKLRFILKRQKRQFQSQDQKIRYKKQKLVNALKLAPRVNQFFFNQFKQKVTTYTIKRRRNDIYSYIQKIIEMNSNNNQVLPIHLKIFFLDMITFLVQQSNQTQAYNQQINTENGSNIQTEENNQNEQNYQQKQGQQEKLLNQQQNQQENDKKQQQTNEQNQPSSRVPIDQWQPQDWQANQSQIKKTQDQLKRRNLSKFIVDLLKQNITEDIQFANSILLCSISYLLGGNNLTQKSILQQINNDEQNKVFVNLMQLIDKLGKFIQKNITEYNNNGQNQQNLFSPTTIDNYDYFDIDQRYCCRKNVFQPNSIDQHLYHQLCIVTYRRAFKFLQLLCENNHIEGKHLIRQQPQKKKQVNFINVATKQLKNLFKKMCKEVSNVPIFLLDFILQVTQIPVKQNQQALMRSTFFEDLCQLQTKKIQQCQQAVQQIFFKSVQIILSNFQGNDEKTFLSLDSKLSQQFLINIMQNKLSKLRIKHKHTGQQISVDSKQKLIKYINDYCNQQDQQGKKITTFSEQLSQVLNVMIIFEKMKDKLGDKSKVRSCYDDLKKKYRNQFEDKVYGKLIQKYGNQNDKQFKRSSNNNVKVTHVYTHIYQDACQKYRQLTTTTNNKPCTSQNPQSLTAFQATFVTTQ